MADGLDLVIIESLIDCTNGTVLLVDSGWFRVCLFVNGNMSTHDSSFDGQVPLLENLDTQFFVRSHHYLCFKY